MAYFERKDCIQQNLYLISLASTCKVWEEGNLGPSVKIVKGTG